MPSNLDDKEDKNGQLFIYAYLDDWAVDYKHRNGRPSKCKGAPLWDEKAHLDSMNAMESGILINKSKDTADFAKAVKQATGKRRSKS